MPPAAQRTGSAATSPAVAWDNTAQIRAAQAAHWVRPAQAPASARNQVHAAILAHEAAQQPRHHHQELAIRDGAQVQRASGAYRTHRRSSGPGLRPNPPRNASGPGGLLPQELTQEIKQAVTWQELDALVKQHAQAMNFIHAAAALSKLPKLWPPQAPREGHNTSQPAMRMQTDQSQLQQQLECVQSLCQLATRHSSQFQHRAVANSLWAASKLLSSLHALPPGHPSNAPLASPHSSTSGATSQPTANPSPAAASPHSLPQAAAQQAAHQLIMQLLNMLPAAVPSFEPQHSANTVYALALLHTSCSTPASPHPALGTPTSTSVPWKPQHLQLLADTVLRHSLVHMSHVIPQGVANMLWAAAQLGMCPDEAWMDAALDTLDTQARRLEPQHASMAVWALAKLGFFPGEDWVAQVLDQAGPQLLTRSSPQSLANTLWGLAVLEVVPAPLHLAGLLRAVCQQACHFGALDIANVLWALAVLSRLVRKDSGNLGDDLSEILQFEDQGAVSEMSARRVRGADPDPASTVTITSSTQLLSSLETSTDEVGHSTISMIRRTAVQVLLASAGLPPVSTQQPATPLQHASPQQLANIVWAASVLRVRPPAAWWRVYWRASYIALPLMNSQEVSNALLGLARLGMCPPDVWWQRCCKVSGRMLTQATAQHLAVTCWAVAQLQLVPTHSWLSACMFKMKQQAGQMDPGALSCCMWTAAKLDVQPGIPWLVTVLLGPVSPGGSLGFTHTLSTSTSSTGSDLSLSLQDTAAVVKSTPVAGGWGRFSLKQLAMVVWSVAALARDELERAGADTLDGLSKVSGVPTAVVRGVKAPVPPGVPSGLNSGTGRQAGVGMTAGTSQFAKRRLLFDRTDSVIDQDASGSAAGAQTAAGTGGGGGARTLEQQDRLADDVESTPGGALSGNDEMTRLGQALLPLLAAVHNQLEQVLGTEGTATNRAKQQAPAQQITAGQLPVPASSLGRSQEVARAVALITWSVSKLMPVLEPAGVEQQQQQARQRKRRAGVKEETAGLVARSRVRALLSLLCDVADQHLSCFSMQMVVQLVVGLAGCKHQVPDSLTGAICTHVHQHASATIAQAASSADHQTVAARPQASARQVAVVVKALVAAGLTLDRSWVLRSTQLVAGLLQREFTQQAGSRHAQLSEDQQAVMCRRYVLKAPEWQLLQAALLQYDITLNLARE